MLVPATPAPAGPVLRHVDGGVVKMGMFDTGTGVELPDLATGRGLIVPRAADAADAGRAFRDFCGGTTPFNPVTDSDPPRLNPETGARGMPGPC